MRSGQILGYFTPGLVVAMTSLPALAREDDAAMADADSQAEPKDANDAQEAQSTESKVASTKGESATTSAESKDHDYLHGGQFSLRMAFVGGYRINSNYDTSPYCQNPVPSNQNDVKKFCGFTAPPALDFALGYAPLNGFEPFAWARFGLTGESETDTKPLMVLGVGARLYTSNDAAFKFFIQPAVGWELEKGQGHANWRGTEYKQDLLIQLLAGPQYDFSRVIGAYAAVGITAGFFRAIETWMEYDIGVQVRLPK